MTNEQIIEMAKQAGDDWDHTLPSDKDFLIAFARLIAAAQREEDARIVDEFSDSGFMFSDAIRNSGGVA